MPVLLRQSRDLPGPASYGFWFAVTGAGPAANARLPDERKLPELARRLEDTYDVVCPLWWEVAQALASGPGAELAYATTCAGYGSDFGLMMAWGRLIEDVADDDGSTLVVCDDPWLFRHLAALPGVEAGAAPALGPATARFMIRGFVARLALVLRLAFSALITRRQRRAMKTGDPVILVYGHPRSTADGHDDYFGPMMTEIPALKRVLHTDCPPGQARSLAADGRTASLHSWGNPWQAPGLLFKHWSPRPEDLSGPYGWLIRRAAVKEAGGAGHAMNAWQRQCQETWMAATRPTVVAWPWENHGWEKAFCRQARRRGVSTVGYQHTVIGPHQLNYNPVTNVDGEESLPDTVVCDGPTYRDQLIDWGVAPDRMVIGGSLRIGRPAGNAYDADGPVFVALSARRSIAHQQMVAVDAAAGQGYSFLVKDHPMYPMDIPETDSIRRARGTVAEQSSLSAVFYSTGTSGLEALLAGLPTFRLLPEDEIAVDVLPDFAAAVAVTAGELTEALGSAAEPRPLPWEDVLAPVDWALWRRLFSSGADVAVASDSTPEPAADRKEKIA